MCELTGPGTANVAGSSNKPGNWAWAVVVTSPSKALRSLRSLRPMVPMIFELLTMVEKIGSGKKRSDHFEVLELKT